MCFIPLAPSVCSGSINTTMGELRLLYFLWSFFIIKALHAENQRFQLDIGGGQASTITKSPRSSQISISTLALQNIAESSAIEAVTETTEIISSVTIVYVGPEGSAYRHFPCTPLREDSC